MSGEIFLLIASILAVLGGGGFMALKKLGVNLKTKRRQRKIGESVEKAVKRLEEQKKVEVEAVIARKEAAEKAVDKEAKERAQAIPELSPQQILNDIQRENEKLLKGLDSDD